MTRKLDFIVFGLPRGGTSATARYLSALEGVHCGQEIFAMREDHSALRIPQDLLSPRKGRPDTAELAQLRDRAPSVSVWGNKTPTYFYRLTGVLEELDGCPAIACVRHPEKVARSYATRAASQNDPWAAGRGGIYAIGDALMLAHALATYPKPDQIVILPQRALLDDWRGALETAAKHTCPGHPLHYRPEALRDINQIRTRQQNRKKTELDPVETHAIKRIERTGLFDLFEGTAPSALDDMQERLRACLLDCPPFPVGFIKRMSQEHQNPEVREYFTRWSAPAARLWKQTKNPIQ